MGQVFDHVSSKYDVMNDLMSAGIHRIWKNKLVEDIYPYSGINVLDVAGGTGTFRMNWDTIQSSSQRLLLGDIAFRIANACSALQLKDTRVVVCDINASMLEQGKKRAYDHLDRNDVFLAILS